MNVNPLTESAAHWNKIILGNKSQSERCNNSAAESDAASPPQLLQKASHSCSFTLTENYWIVRLCFSAWQLLVWRAAKRVLAQEQRKSCRDKASRAHAHTLGHGVAECARGDAVPSRQELAWESRGGQGGARWRPLQIWLLLKVLWSAHVYPLAQRWYSGLCGAWDKGPGLFEVKLIPQTMLVVIAPSLFFDTPHPHPLPPVLFFFFFQRNEIWRMQMGSF